MNLGPETLERDADEMAETWGADDPSVLLMRESVHAWREEIAARGMERLHASAIEIELRNRIEALEKQLEEAVWLLNHDSGDIGGVGRKGWLKRRDILYAALAQEKPEADDE
jgi:hypothetical protein